MRLPLLACVGLAISAHSQNTFEITIPVPGLTNVAGGHQLPDGGFVFGGELNDGLVVVRTDSTGGVLWTRVLAESGNQEGLYDRSIAVSGGLIYMGGYAMGSGTSSRDGILHVIGLDGQTWSQQRIDVAGGSNAIHGITAIPGGALLAGRREGAGNYDMLLQRVEAGGSMTGSWSYGSSGWDWAYEAALLTNGDMALVGYGDGVGGPAPSAYLVRANAAGQPIWSIGLDGASADEAYSVLEDPATGDLYIGGRTLGMGQMGVAGFISKFTAAGVHQWTRVVGNAFDVIGMVATGGRFAALLRAQSMIGGHGSYDELLLFFNSAGDLLGNRLFGTAGSDYATSLSATATGGLLITSLRSGPNAIRAVLTDQHGNGACTGTVVQVGWASYTPTVYNHTSTVQSGSMLVSWPTPNQQPLLNRQFMCCTYPVEASFEAIPGNALGYTFLNTSSGGGTATWTIEGATYTGDAVEHSFSAPGNHTVCLTVHGVCAQDTDCQEIAVATLGMEGLEQEATLRLRPNPATDRLWIGFHTDVQLLELLDVHGRLLRVISPNGRRMLDIDLNGIPAGVLLLRTTDPAGVHTHRLVKE